MDHGNVRALAGRWLLPLATFGGLGGCSDDGTRPPAAIDTAGVATIDVTPAAASALAGATVQLAAVAKDARGAAVQGVTLVWASSDAGVAAVSSTGLVTTKQPGNAVITARVGLVAGTAAVESVDPIYIPVFQRPFDVNFEYRTTNYHDHNEPRQFIDANGIYLPWWGEPSGLGAEGIDGHEGYDWELPVGTPIHAVAPGRVIVATVNTPPVFCPLLGRDVDDNAHVRISHDLPGGVRVITLYVHLDRIDVVPGQDVVAGQQIGLSGNRGCSGGPHLHFAVNRLTQLQPGITFSPIDPYGWDGGGPDPWELNPAGAQSTRLWQPGEAPSLFRVRLSPHLETPGSFVRITAVQFQGVRDDLNPNNEYVEVSRDGRVAPDQLDISGFTITTKASLTFTFPAGSILSEELPGIRVYTGSGTPAPGTLFWGRSAGVYDNFSECVRFFNLAGVLRNQSGWGGGCSP